jgi:hypothetical protein
MTIDPTPLTPSDTADDDGFRRITAFTFLLILYTLGIFHWTYFYRSGEFDLFYLDWFKEYSYYSLIRQSLETGQIPYHYDQRWPDGQREFHQSTDKFLGLPESNLAPDILLLPWVDTSKFFVVHTIVLYTVGFIGCLALRRRYRIGWIPFTALWLLFNFNGYITSHLSVGHSMWNGYFLLSFLVYYLLECIDRPTELTPALALAAVLFGMMLVGDFHQVIWCWLFLAAFLAFNFGHWKQVVVAIGFSVWLSIFRLLPAFVALAGMKKRAYLGGYPDLTELFHSLVTLRDSDYPKMQILGWWEYDAYIGWFGLAFVVYFGIYRRWRDSDALATRYTGLDAPLLVLTFLSVNYFYACVGHFPIFNAERVSSRFIIVPLVFVIALAAIHMQRFIQTTRMNAALYVLFIGGLIHTVFALGEHNWIWRVPAAESGMVLPAPATLIAHSDDARYVAAVQISAVMSLLGAIAWIAALIWSRLPSDRFTRPTVADATP